MIRHLWLLPEDKKFEIMEKVFSVPVAEREALFKKLVEECEGIEYLGATDKKPSELAIELTKQGIYTTSHYVDKKETNE